MSRRHWVAMLVAGCVGSSLASRAFAQEPPLPPPPPAAPLPPAPPPTAPPDSPPTPQAPIIVVLPPGAEPPPGAVIHDELPPSWAPLREGPPPRYVPPPFVPPPYQPPPFVPPTEPRSRTAFRFEADATFSRIYDIPVTGGGGTIGVGGEFRNHLAAYGNLTAFFGEQQTGLVAVQIHVWGDIEGRFGPFRIGAGLAYGELILARATSGDATEAPTFGCLALTSLDVVTWGEKKTTALYLHAKIRADVAVGLDASPLIWGPTFGVGIRY